MEMLWLFIRMVGALAVVSVAIILSLKFGLPFLNPKTMSKNKMLNVTESIALTPRISVYVVKVGNEYMLLGVTGEKVTYLKSVPVELLEDIDAGVSEELPESNFKNLLNLKLFKKGNENNEDIEETNIQ